MADRKLSLTITGNAKSAQKALGDLDKAAGKSEKSVKKSGGGIKSALAGLGIGAALVGSFKAFDEASKVGAQSEAVIKSTGGAANVTAKQMGDLAGAISKKTGIDDEAIQSGENMIATFTNIRNEAGKGNDVFDQTTRAAVDMSAAMGGDAKSAAMLLGKALNDPVAGLGSLTKNGVTFTNQQKDMIKTLVESGDTLGAQKLILGEVNKEFGGSAEGQATSLGKAQVAVDNMAESLGGALAPALNVVADGASILADAIGALPVPLQTGVVLAAGAGAVWLKYGDKLAGAGEKSMKAGTKMVGFTQNLGSLGPLATAGGIATVGLGAAVLGFSMEAENAKKRAAQLNAEIKSIREEALSTGKSVKEVFADTTIPSLVGDNADDFKKYKIDVGSLTKAVTGGKGEWERYRAAVLEANGQTAAATTGMTGLEIGLDDMRAQYVGATKSTKAQRDATKETAEATDKTAGSMTNLERATGSAKTENAMMAASLQNAADAAGEARDNLQAYYDTVTSNLSGQIGAEAALDGFSASIAEHGRSLDIDTEAGRANQQALIAMKDAAFGSAEAYQESGGTAQGAADQMIGYSNRLAEAAKAAGYTDDEVTMMLTSMGLTPSQIQTKFVENADQAKIKTQNYGRAVDALAREKRTNFHATVTGLGAVRVALDDVARERQARVNVAIGNLTNTTGLSTGEIFGRASGGPVNAGQPYLVGEEGPELVTFGQKGMVHDAAATRATLAGGGGASRGVGGGAAPIIVNVHAGHVISGDGFIKMVIKGINEAQARSGRALLVSA